MICLGSGGCIGALATSATPRGETVVGYLSFDGVWMTYADGTEALRNTCPFTVLGPGEFV